MINYFKDKKLFILSNNDFSYAFYVNEIGVLVKLYFGKPIKFLEEYHFKEINDVGFDIYNYYSLKDNKEYGMNDDYFSGYGSLLEIPTFLTYDKRTPLIIINHDDNSSLTDFRYVSHKVIPGKENLAEMPYFKGNQNECETLKVLLKDIKDEIYLEASYTIFKDLNVLVRKNKIINKSKKAIKILKAGSLNLDLPSNDYKLISVHGIYATDRSIEENEIKHNTISISDNAGAKGFYHNPMCMLKKNDATDTFGEVIGCGLLYSGNFNFEFMGTNLEGIRATFGINAENFEWILNSEEEFNTPECALIYSSRGTDFVTNTFHDLIRNHLLRKVEGFEKTILLNSWEGIYMNFDTEKIINFIDLCPKFGINMFVLDDGWFGKRNSDDSSLGDWYINKDKIDLKKCVEYAHSKNIKFGIWIEPEMISYNSDLFRKNPQYALFDRSENPTVLRHQFVLDIINEKARNQVLDDIFKVFDECHFDYCKWDFNRLLTEVYSSSLKKEEQKEIYHLFTLATYDMLNKFINRYPNVLLETCAGGGGRFDMGMLFYSSQIWGSDETDAVCRTTIQYATNMFYPLKTIGAHISNRKFLSIKEKGAVAMFGTYGYEIDITKLTDKDLGEVEIANKRFLENKDLIDNGDYFGLIDPFKDNNLVSFEVVSKEKDRAIIFYMNYRQFNWGSKYLKLKGLDPNKKYINDLNNQVYYGDFYANVGLNLSTGMLSFTPLLITLKEVK